MANRHMKRCSISPNIRKMQVTTTMRYHLTPVRIAIINKSTNSKCWHRWGERETSLHCWWECRLVQPLWKAVWRYFKNLKMELPMTQQFHFWEFIQRKLKHKIQKKVSISMFIAALFTITKIWKQPKCPSVHEWVKQLGTYTQ